ncbi:hypothetical protein ISS22_00325 [candidate division KSB1 bacterium]|nr:hypothetical protein [candidate division KSB1 bacterium]
MLYKIGYDEQKKFASLSPIAFKDFVSFGKKEKELEDLIAKNILEVLFEESSLMPIFQEESGQARADIYALNENGELVVFELKRGSAAHGAVHQALRYTEEAGQWSYSKLEKEYQAHVRTNTELSKAHTEVFGLNEELEFTQFNNKQYIVVIGSAADDSLISAVDYWKNQGLSIDFLPYRIYTIDGEHYFEFFALPYDKHLNPGFVKGVLFDTNRNYNPNSIWDMIEHSTIEAYGDSKRFVEHVSPGDIVFFSHKMCGVIAAAKVKKGILKKPDDQTYARDVEFLTPVPSRGNTIKAIVLPVKSLFFVQKFFLTQII